MKLCPDVLSSVSSMPVDRITSHLSVLSMQWVRKIAYNNSLLPSVKYVLQFNFFILRGAMRPKFIDEWVKLSWVTAKCGNGAGTLKQDAQMFMMQVVRWSGKEASVERWSCSSGSDDSRKSLFNIYEGQFRTSEEECYHRALSFFMTMLGSLWSSSFCSHETLTRTLFWHTWAAS